MACPGAAEAILSTAPRGTEEWVHVQVDPEPNRFWIASAD